MSYTVLARKYRSQTFDDVIGQDPIARTLKNAINSDRVAHAYLFTGTRGVGKTTLARVLAKSLNCLAADKPTTEPCCKCESCIAVNAGEDIDVIEIDGASNNGVDEIRKLRENVIYRPARARFKIYIIDEVHMLTTGAFNALLKTLEEPPSHVKFIFATTEPNKVIATIQSRCQRFDFSSITPAAIAKQLEFVLKAEKIKYADDLVLPLAKMANGSMRDALSLLDRLISSGAEPLDGSLLEEFLGCADSEKVWNLIEKIGENDAGGTLTAADELMRTGTSEVQIVDSLVDYMRDLMVVKSAGADSELLILTGQQRKRAGELAEKFDIAGLVYSIATLEKLRWAIKNSDTARALLEASLLRFALSEHFMNVDQLLAQLRGGAAGGVKKKRGAVSSPASSQERHPTSDIRHTGNEPRGTTEEGRRTTDDGRQIHGSMANADSPIDDWPGTLALIGEKLGPGTKSLLEAAAPGRFENGVLTLEFPASAKMQKEMCESNGRVEQIQTMLSEQFSTPLKLNLELADAATETKAQTKQEKTHTQRDNELINDPAVKTVLLGLDAKVIGIDEE
jgi:DNA polymerase-3 subunit gamma/tau